MRPERMTAEDVYALQRRLAEDRERKDAEHPPPEGWAWSLAYSYGVRVPDLDRLVPVHPGRPVSIRFEAEEVDVDRFTPLGGFVAPEPGTYVWRDGHFERAEDDPPCRS